jgi:hypothetical protein
MNVKSIRESIENSRHILEPIKRCLSKYLRDKPVLLNINVILKVLD